MVKVTDSLSGSFEFQGLKMDENIAHFKELLLLELTRKSSDLNHRQLLQQLLIQSLKENDLNKAFLINTFLNPNQGLNNVNFLNNDSNLNENQEAISSGSKENSINSSVIDKNYLNFTTETDKMNDLAILNQTNTEAIKIDKSQRPKLRGSPLSPIRHLVCSPGLEEKAEKHKIVILYRGTCNGSCNPNKLWTKQSHVHYIINTLNCNDHVSRLVKKQGLQFFNSYVLQNPERWNHLIKLYKMEKA